MALLTMIILILFLPMIHEIIHLLILISIYVRISKYDVDDGVSLTLP